MATAQAAISEAAPRQSLGSRAFGVLQKLGRALMIPVAVLPAADDRHLARQGKTPALAVVAEHDQNRLH